MCCLRFTNLFLMFLSVVVYNICEYFLAYASFLVLPLYAVGVYTVVCIYYASILLSTCTIWTYLGTLPLFFSLCFSYKKKKKMNSRWLSCWWMSLPCNLALYLEWFLNFKKRLQSFFSFFPCHLTKKRKCIESNNSPPPNHSIA